MASLLTTFGEISKVKGIFGTKFNTPVYLQFVPGICGDVVTSREQLESYNKEEFVNTILALPHFREDGVKKKLSELDNTDRYYPLLRGIREVPTKGDPVLLCEIGGKKYYLGPLNTQNQINFNQDNLKEAEINVTKNLNNREGNKRKAAGESRNFIKEQYSKMVKPYHPKLDGTKAYNENHGDLMLEGRHGNSIRVGSRKDNSHIFISNGRRPTFKYESLADGGIIALIERGTLAQHFGGHFRQINPDVDGDGAGDATVDLEDVGPFTLASDYKSSTEESPKRLMSKLISSVNNDQDVNELIYNFGKVEEDNTNTAKPDNENQMLFYSDRIIINSKTNDIYLSSNNDIHIGTKRHLTISTNENLIIESEKTFLGDPNKKEMDNMVLGKKLQKVLKDILKVFEVASYANSGGPAFINKASIESSVKLIDGEIDNIISTKHKIEQG